MGVVAKTGLSWGGDKMLDAYYVDGSKDDMYAGGNLLASLGVRWTPVRVGEILGLGLALDAGLRHANLFVFSDGNVNFDRSTLAPTVHGLLRLGGIWFVTAGAGIQYESGIRLRGNGVLADIDERFRPSVGPTAEIGIMAMKRVSGVGVGFDLALRRTLLSYTPNSTGKAINANSTAVVLGLDFYL